MALQGAGASPGTTSLLWRCSDLEGLQWYCNHDYLYQCSWNSGICFFPLQQDMTVPPGSASACLEEHPAWTEKKLTRTFGAGSGYAGRRPMGIFTFQFQSGNYKWIQLAGSVVWEDAQRPGNRRRRNAGGGLFHTWNAWPQLAPLSSEVNHGSTSGTGEHLWAALTLGNVIWPFQGRQVGSAGRNVSISSFLFFREDTH